MRIQRLGRLWWEFEPLKYPAWRITKHVGEWPWQVNVCLGDMMLAIGISKSKLQTERDVLRRALDRLLWVVEAHEPTDGACRLARDALGYRIDPPRNRFGPPISPLQDDGDKE